MTEQEKQLRAFIGSRVKYDDNGTMIWGGDPLYFVDHDNGGDYSQVVTLAMVHERVQMTPIANLLRIKAEEDDADDADAILQTVLYKEIIFG